MPTSPAKELDENFATNVRAAREEQGWSQAELVKRLQDAGLSNFHPTTVSRMEKGERTVSLGEARAISRVLMRSLDDLTAAPVEYQRARRLERILYRINTEWDFAIVRIGRLLTYRQALWRHLRDVEYSEDQKSLALETLSRYSTVNLVDDALVDIEESVQKAKARREAMHGQHPEET